jgi:hypothetical protein
MNNRIHFLKIWFCVVAAFIVIVLGAAFFVWILLNTPPVFGWTFMFLTCTLGIAWGLYKGTRIPVK